MEMHIDSAEVRGHGVALQTAAGELSDIVRALHAQVEDARFSGPAAERFRAAMQEREARIARVSQELDDLAGLVQQYADSLPA